MPSRPGRILELYLVVARLKIILVKKEANISGDWRLKSEVAIFGFYHFFMILRGVRIILFLDPSLYLYLSYLVLNHIFFSTFHNLHISKNSKLQSLTDRIFLNIG